MTKALFKLFILFITCSTAISCSEQDSPELPDNSGNTNQGIASIDQTQINANGGGFIIRVKAEDRKSTRLNSSHKHRSRMPSSA